MAPTPVGWREKRETQAGRQAPGYCHLVNALATGAGTPDGGVVGRDPPDQARLRQVAEEQAALRRVATLVARGEPPETVFAAVAEEVGRLLAVDFAILVRYDPQDTLEVVGTWIRTGAPPPTPVGGQLPLGGRNVTTMVYRTGRPAGIDYSDVSGVIGQVASRDWGLRSSVGVPVSAESRLWGCIVVAFSGQELMPADTEARLASFTELVATAIANADSRAELARLAEEQAALRRVATLVARGAPPEEMFAAVIEEIARLLPVNVAGFIRYDPDGMFTYVAAWGKAVDYVPPVGSRWMLGGHNLGTLVFETGRPARLDHYVDNSSGPASYVVRKVGYDSAVGAPVIVEGHLWGLIGASSTLGQPSQREDRGPALRVDLLAHRRGEAQPGQAHLRDRPHHRAGVLPRRILGLLQVLDDLAQAGPLRPGHRADRLDHRGFPLLAHPRQQQPQRLGGHRPLLRQVDTERERIEQSRRRRAQRQDAGPATLPGEEFDQGFRVTLRVDHGDRRAAQSQLVDQQHGQRRLPGARLAGDSHRGRPVTGRRDQRVEMHDGAGPAQGLTDIRPDPAATRIHPVTESHRRGRHSASDGVKRLPLHIRTQPDPLARQRLAQQRELITGGVHHVDSDIAVGGFHLTGVAQVSVAPIATG